MPNYDAVTLQKEQGRRFNNVVGFIKQAETRYPNLTKQLPNLLSKMLGSQTFNPQLMEQNAGNVAIGAAVLGDWLQNSGFVGFKVNLSTVDSFKTGAAKAFVSLPTRDSFFQTSGVPRDSWQEMQNAMVDFSGRISEALEIGYTPRQVVAALFIESTVKPGEERTNTSVLTREMLNKASGGQLPKVNQILNSWVQGK